MKSDRIRVQYNKSSNMKKSKNSSFTYGSDTILGTWKGTKKKSLHLWSLLSMGRQIINKSVLNNDETRVDVCVCVYI